MNGTTSTAIPTTSEPRIAQPVVQRWMSVVFLQGKEADAVLDRIDRDGPEAAIDHLSQWDFGDETRDAALVNGYVYDEIPQSHTDRVIRDTASGYALTYNRHFGYVALLRHFVPIVDEAPKPVAPPRKFGPDRPRITRCTNGLQL